MTLNELIETLTDISDNEDAGEMEVRGAYQPNYPLVGSISAVTLDPHHIDGGRVWLALRAVGYQESPYAPSHAWDGDVVESEEAE